MIAWQLFTIDEPGKLYDANALYLNVLRNVLISLVQADWCMPGGPTGFFYEMFRNLAGLPAKCSL